jgi:methylated-DNA-[protein]-cysteine S-methyltransferase
MVYGLQFPIYLRSVEKESILFYHSPIGLLEIKGTDSGITSILFYKEKQKEKAPIPEVLKACAAQVDEYFRGRRKIFDVPLHLNGTSFQIKVWNELLKIPYGETVSYLDIALKVGNEKMIRAVGGANGKNPISIIVPCHRVIGTDGKLVGYGGGLWRKEWLLNHETKYSNKPTGQLKLAFTEE